MATQVARVMNVREGEDVFFVERITRPDGTLHVPGDFPGGTPVALEIWDRTAEAAPAYIPVPVALGGIVFTPALTDGYWEGRDSTGYNFIFRLPTGAFPLSGGRIYDVEFSLTGTFGGSAIVKRVLFVVNVQPIGSA